MEFPGYTKLIPTRDMREVENQVSDLQSRIAELESENKRLAREVQARDKVLDRFGVMPIQTFCKTCAYRNRHCTSISRNCIAGNIEFAIKEIENAQ